MSIRKSEARAGSPRRHFPPGAGSVARPTVAVHAARRGFSKVTAPSAAPRIRNRNTRSISANVTGAHSIKGLIELFQKFAESRGRASGRSPQRAKLPSVQELGGFGDLR